MIYKPRLIFMRWWILFCDDSHKVGAQAGPMTWDESVAEGKRLEREGWRKEQ